MSGLAKGLAAALGGAAVGALGQVANNKAAQKKSQPKPSTPTKPAADAPSYSIAHDMRTAGADTQTPDTE